MKYFKNLLLLIILPLFAMGETTYYGEDAYDLGIPLDAFALGKIKAVSLTMPALGGIASSYYDDSRMSFNHSSGFGGIYNTDILQWRKGDKNISIFRGAVDEIADTRNALVDNGLDGEANTYDIGEGNGILDPGERLNVNKIDFFSVSQWVIEGGYSKAYSDRIKLYGAARILLHNLYTQTGFGIGFHAGVEAEPIEHLRLGLMITDILTTTIFWSDGLIENYAPQASLGVVYEYKSKRTPFAFKPVLQYKMSGLEDANGFAFGLEMGFKDQVFLRSGRDDTGFVTLGAGIKTHYLQIDYATFISDIHATSGQTHRVGISFSPEKLFFKK
jgi:hypothetical protein